MTRKVLISLPFLALSLAACDQVKVPGINPIDTDGTETAEIDPAAVDPEVTEASTDPAPETETTSNDPDYTYIGNYDPTPGTTPDAPIIIHGERTIVDGNVYEKRALGNNEWMMLFIGSLAGRDDPNGPYFTNGELRNGVDVANAAFEDFRDGDRYIEDGALFERTIGLAGRFEVRAVDSSEAPEIPPGPDVMPPNGAEPDDTPPPTLAELNAVKCGLVTETEDTPTIGMVAGATTVEEPRIGAAAVNALASQLASFPGIVKMEPRDITESGAVSSGHCGATRIANNWFVTAAHCVDKQYREIQLIAGSENIRSPVARTLLASDSICHGGYGGMGNGYANDIALIRLSDDALETLGDVPIANYSATQKALTPVNYETVDMAGWGITSFGGQLSNELLGATLTLDSAGPALINVSSRAGAGPCIGDSGGPLFVTEEDGTRTIVGVLSVVEQNRATGQFCAGDYKGRYTHVQGYTDWIQAVITACETNEETCR